MCLCSSHEGEHSTQWLEVCSRPQRPVLKPRRRAAACIRLLSGSLLAFFEVECRHVLCDLRSEGSMSSSSCCLACPVGGESDLDEATCRWLQPGAQARRAEAPASTACNARGVFPRLSLLKPRRRATSRGFGGRFEVFVEQPLILSMALLQTRRVGDPGEQGQR